MTDSLKERLKKVELAVYLASDADVADHIASHIREAVQEIARLEAMAETVRTLEGERDRLRRVVNAAWGAFTDADEVGTPLWEALEKEGFVVCREATKADAAEAFAYERGIYPGGRIIELTPAGRAALNPTGVGKAG